MIKSLIFMSILLSIAVVTPLAATGEDAPAAIRTPPPADALAFWGKFRAAVIARDQASLVALTAFPFRTRGMLDGDPRREWSRERFPQVLPRILTRQVIEEITRHPELGAADEDSRGRWQRFAVGDLKFEKTAQGWRFVFAFIEEE